MTPAEIITLLKGGRKLFTLIVVMIAAAGFYYWMERAKADRAMLLGDAREICEAAGAPYQPDGSKQKTWGDACLKRVRDLRAVESQMAEIETGLAQGNADALLKVAQDRLGKSSADAALAAAMSKQTAEAVQQMERANAAVEGDRVGPGWAAAVNELGGLR